MGVSAGGHLLAQGGLAGGVVCDRFVFGDGGDDRRHALAEATANVLSIVAWVFSTMLCGTPAATIASSSSHR